MHRRMAYGSDEAPFGFDTRTKPVWTCHVQWQGEGGRAGGAYAEQLGQAERRGPEVMPNR